METHLVAGRSGAAKSFPAERTYLSADLPPARLEVCFDNGRELLAIEDSVMAVEGFVIADLPAEPSVETSRDSL